MIKKFNICTCKVYQAQGQEKKFWPQVGTMTYFPAYQDHPEGYKIELNMFPGTQFFTFEQKSPESRTTDAKPTEVIDAETGAVRRAVPPRNDKNTPPKVVGGIDYPTEEINPEDIPF
jgi:hypothetical protein